MRVSQLRKLLVPEETGTIFLGHCAISPLYRGAAEAISKFGARLAAGGIGALSDYFDVMPTFHEWMGKLLQTSAANISYVHNTAEAFCMVGNGYPFEPGDQVISYCHEYPSNHYPWVLQKTRGVELILLSDEDRTTSHVQSDRPKGWSMEELELLVTDRTRVVAISHVQFSSGYGADLEELGKFCKSRNIDLIVDCAQSLGCLPVYPEEYNIAALASSAWKWLLGPKGSGVLYTSPEFRQKLGVTMAGPGLMKQGLNYLDHSWNPHTDGRMFEYSTLPWDHVAGLNRVLQDIFLQMSIEDTRRKVLRLQDVLLHHLDRELIAPLIFQEQHRSGILTATLRCDVQELVQKLAEKGVVVTAPIGYLRLAPHFYQEDDEMVQAARLINEVCFQMSSH